MNIDEIFLNLNPLQRSTMAHVGANWARDMQAGRDAVLQIYEPLAARAGKGGVQVLRDVCYGEHPRHTLDLFVPDDAHLRDVVIFVHGGAFVRGDKRVNDEVYDNVGYWFARQGLIVVNMEYRLAPEAPYPGGAEDLARVVEWCERNVAAHGGNAHRIFLMGHSAGATHVGTYLLDPVMAGPPSMAVQAAILVSGRMRADTRPENPNAHGVRAYFGADERQYEARSPVTFAHRAAVPLFLAFAEFENPLLDGYSLEFALRVQQARGHAPEVVQMPRHNHTSMMAHFNCGEELLGRRIMAFMQRSDMRRGAQAR